VTDLRYQKYDRALVNHNNCLRLIMDLGVAKRIVFTTHGAKPLLEQPIPGADSYVSISERVQRHLRESGYESNLIRNGIELDRFRPIKPLSPKLTRLGLLSRHTRAIPMLREVCRNIGCELFPIRNVLNVPAAINECDAIATIGRGVVEALACSRPVLIFDQPTPNLEAKTDGWFSVECGIRLASWNYTGWCNNFMATAPRLEEYLRLYSDANADKYRIYVTEHHDIAKIAEQYLIV
jgi:glycosyltransferase involved in cell wall biosynthesis